MPYIKKDGRAQIDDAITRLPVTMTEGDLNYAITKILDREVVLKGRSYARFNMLHGTLFSVAAEFYRRIIAPYEDVKIAENGDVYDSIPK